MMTGMGRMLIIIGVLFIFIGLGFLFADKFPYIGRLPGDIFIKRDKFSFYFPITTSIIISIVLTVLFSIFRR